jgi:uncharacterized protein
MSTNLTPDALFSRTLELCRLAKVAKLNVTQSRVIDAFRSLQSVQWQNEDEVRLALRTNLAGSREEEETFDRVFATYWYGSPDETDQGARLRPRTELVRGEFDVGFQESHQELLGKTASFGGEDMVRELNLTARWDAEAPPVGQIIRELAKRLATRPSRRVRPAARGRRLDLRRSLRRNVRHGMDVVELARVERRVRKTRIVMLCDVSGSMDVFNPFLLRLMFGLQKELKNSRTVVFSTRTSEITSLLRRRSVQQTLRGIGEQVRHWSGGTDIGGALTELNRGVLREGSARSTVAVIISDGYDNGEPEVIRREMKALRRRVRTVVWVNPMYGAQTFAVRAGGMRAAMPYIDHFLPAFNARSLRLLVRELARV